MHSFLSTYIKRKQVLTSILYTITTGSFENFVFVTPISNKNT